MVTFVKFSDEMACFIIKEYIERFSVSARAVVAKSCHRLWYFFYRARPWRLSPSLYVQTPESFERLHDVRISFGAADYSKKYVFIPYVYRGPRHSKYRLCVYYCDNVELCNSIFNELKSSYYENQN